MTKHTHGQNKTQQKPLSLEARILSQVLFWVPHINAIKALQASQSFLHTYGTIHPFVVIQNRTTHQTMFV